MKEKKKIEFKNDIDKKIEIVKKILENVCTIMTLFKPLLEQLLELEEAKLNSRDGTFDKAAFLFGEIARQCKKLQSTPISDDFLNKLQN